MKISNIALAIMLSLLPHNLTAAECDSTLIVNQINASGNIKVIQPDGMQQRLARPIAEQGDDDSGQTATASVKTPSSTKAGYRIQVFDDNNPRTAHREALAKKDQMSAAFPAYRTYVVFNSPYWRVKVGDFRSRTEAEAAKNEIVHAFPSLAAYVRIVRDRINVFD